VQLAAAFPPASSLAGISITSTTPILPPISLSRAKVPANKLAGAKAAASCTHSKASLHGVQSFVARTLLLAFYVAHPRADVTCADNLRAAPENMTGNCSEKQSGVY